MSNFFHRGNPNQAAENLKRIWQDSDDQENEMIFEKISSDNESSDHQSSLKFSSKFENHKATRQLSSKRRRNVIEISESSEDEANTELGQKKTNSQGSIRCRKESVINVARIRSKNNIIDCENFESINDESCIPNTRIDEVNLVDVDCTQMPNNNKDQEYSDIREVEEKILKHQKMLEKVCNSVLSKECTSTVTKSLDKDMDIPSLVTVVIIDRFSYYSGDKNSDKGHSSTYTVDSHDNLLSIYQRHCEKMRLNLRGKILTCEGRKLYMSMTAISLAAKYPDCTLHIEAWEEAVFKKKEEERAAQRDVILNYKASERTPDVDILVDANLAFINDLSSECRPVESLITLKVHGKSRVSAAGRFEESFSVSIYDRLKLIYDRLPEGSVLRFDGDKLPPQLTIHEAGLEDGDMLELF